MRDVLQLLLAAAVVLAMGLVSWQLFFEGSDATPLTIALVRGTVDLQRDGASTPATIGTELRDDDRVISGADGAAVIAVGEDSNLTLEPGSTMRVVGRDESSVEVEMEGGRVKAVVRPGGVEVSVLAGGRRVRATDATFTAGVRDGAAAVEVSEGSVGLEGFLEGSLEGSDEPLTLGAGQRIVAPADGPSRQSPIPSELLLEVAWPTRRTRETDVIVEGRTEPNARVSIQSPSGTRQTTADDAGRFEVMVGLTDGENALLVTSEGLLGDRSDVTWAVVRDAEGPTADVEVRY